MTELDSELESYYLYNIRSDINVLSKDKANNNIETNLDLEGISLIATNSNTTSRLIIVSDSSTDELILYRYPYYTLFIALTNCIIYFYGIFFIISIHDAQFSMKSPISPPQPSWYFETITDWSSCNDLRDNYWRLISFQFVHASLMHLFGNTLAIISYGVILESHNSIGILKTIIIYQTSVIIGALGHSYIWPYIGIIGASPGGYGIIGGCWAQCLFNSTGVQMSGLVKSTFAIRLILIALFVQLIYDIISYIYFYNSTISYIAHACGLYTGFTLCLSYNITKPCMKHRMLGMIGISGLLVAVVFLCYHHYHIFPPVPYIRTWLHNQQQVDGCCAELFDYMESLQLSKSEILQISTCRNNKLFIL